MAAGVRKGRRGVVALVACCLSMAAMGEAAGQTSQPQTGQPQTGQPQTGQPQTGQPQTGQPQTGQPQTGQPQTDQPLSRLANPASVRCAESGGGLRLERLPSGGEYGVCIFGDNRQCEEWALFRGDCPAGGLRVTGYVTPAARFCAITGGRYAVTAESGTADEKGTCTLPGGKVCDAAAYYGATCSRERP